MLCSKLLSDEYFYFSGLNISSAHEQFECYLSTHSLEIDRRRKHVFEWIVVEWIKLIGRSEVGHRFKEPKAGRIFESEIGCPSAGPERSTRPEIGHFLPIRSQCFFCPFAASSSKAIGEHNSVDCTGARSRDAVEMELFFLEHAVEHAPSKSAVAAATLECQVYNFPFPRVGILPFDPI